MDKRVVFPAFAGLWYSHTKAWGCGERERLMGNAFLMISFFSRKNKGPGFQAVLGLE